MAMQIHALADFTASLVRDNKLGRMSDRTTRYHFLEQKRF